MTSPKVPGIARILSKSLSLLKYLGFTTSPPFFFFLERTFHYLAQKLHCLPQTQFNFLLYSVGLALSDFWQ